MRVHCHWACLDNCQKADDNVIQSISTNFNSLALVVFKYKRLQGDNCDAILAKQSTDMFKRAVGCKQEHVNGGAINRFNSDTFKFVHILRYPNSYTSVSQVYVAAIRTTEQSGKCESTQQLQQLHYLFHNATKTISLIWAGPIRGTLIWKCVFNCLVTHDYTDDNSLCPALCTANMLQ